MQPIGPQLQLFDETPQLKHYFLLFGLDDDLTKKIAADKASINQFLEISVVKESIPHISVIKFYQSVNQEPKIIRYFSDYFKSINEVKGEITGLQDEIQNKLSYEMTTQVVDSLEIIRDYIQYLLRKEKLIFKGNHIISQSIQLNLIKDIPKAKKTKLGGFKSAITFPCPININQALLLKSDDPKGPWEVLKEFKLKKGKKG
ncbi:MAG: hypothetical protein SFY32_15280 [Bacteroidota bacterium]|nr:hypothetical protein [Bacteroidota bacterium]